MPFLRTKKNLFGKWNGSRRPECNIFYRNSLVQPLLVGRSYHMDFTSAPILGAEKALGPLSHKSPVDIASIIRPACYVIFFVRPIFLGHNCSYVRYVLCSYGTLCSLTIPCMKMREGNDSSHVKIAADIFIFGLKLNPHPSLDFH